MEENSGGAPSPQKENDIVADGDNLPSAASDAGHTPCAEGGGRGAVASDGEKSAKTAARAIKNAGGRRKRRYPSG